MKTYIVGFDWGDVHLVTEVNANNKKEAGQLLKKEWGRTPYVCYPLHRGGKRK